MRYRLSLLMFLQYAAPGAFLPLYSVYLEKLGYTPLLIGLFCATQGVATVLCPLFAGHIADRWVAAERCLAVCSFLAGIILWLVADMTHLTPPWMLFTATLGYWLLAVPLLLLGNAICFAHLKDPPREFGRVRLWGTVGWMVQPWIVLAARFCVPGLSVTDCTSALFRLGSVLSFVLAGYALTLPATPPLRPMARRFAPLAALAGMNSGPLLIYFVCIFGVSIAQPFMTQGAPLLLKSLAIGEFWLGPLVSFSQVTEIISLALLPLIMYRLGVRGTILVGLAAYTASFAFLALGSPRELMVGSLGFNGLCITGFMVAGQVFVHRQATAEVRASVQGLLTFVNGAGMLLGNLFIGMLRYAFDYELTQTFGVAAALMGAMVLLFMMGFREHKALAPAQT